MVGTLVRPEFAHNNSGGLDEKKSGSFHRHALRGVSHHGRPNAAPLLEFMFVAAPYFAIPDAKTEHYVPALLFHPRIANRFNPLRCEYHDWSGGFAVQPCGPAGRHGRQQIAHDPSRKCLRGFPDRSSIYGITGQPAHVAR